MDVDKRMYFAMLVRLFTGTVTMEKYQKIKNRTII